MTVIGRIFLVLGVLLIVVSGCTTDKQTLPSTGQYKVGNPYQINGVWYYPKEDPFYDETGVASWYGSDFHGKSTANGEKYDMNALTAAHRTLPLPTIVRVTNLDNGRSIRLRVNDRGPYARGRIIDVSRRAADLLGFQSNGTAKVRVQFEGRAKAGSSGPDPDDAAAGAIKAAPLADVAATELAPPPGAISAPRPVNSSSATPVTMAPVNDDATDAELDGTVTTAQIPPAGQLWVQVGAFSSRSNAQRVVAGLQGVGAASISQTVRSGKPFFRVRFGPFAEVSRADVMLDKIISAGQNGAQIIVE